MNRSTYSRGPANPDRSSVESEGQAVLFAKVQHLVPQCGPLDPRPSAVVGIDDNKFARVCAWHDGGAGLSEANAWCEARGLEITHGCCDACGAAIVAETWDPQPSDARLLELMPEKHKRDREELSEYCSRIRDDGTLIDREDVEEMERNGGRIDVNFHE